MTPSEIQTEIDLIRESCESWAGKRKGPRVMTEKEMRIEHMMSLLNKNPYSPGCPGWF
jgi:hypothetical protein